MIDHNGPADIGSRKVIDVAIGVLVGLRGCTPADAFSDLASAVHDTGLGLGTLAAALVELASGTSDPYPHRTVVTARWGTLVTVA